MPGMTRRVLLSLMIATTSPALAQGPVAIGLTTTGQPTTVTLSGQNAGVGGFRGATWGMTPDQVRAALASDFGGAKAGALIDDPVEGTQALIAPMVSLTPGPGPAAITYIFGGKSGRLMHVNLDWTVANAGAADQSAILDGGSRLVADFVGSFWKLGSVMRGVVVRPNVIILFAGADEKGGGVDVRVGGVPYAMRVDGEMRTIAPTAKSATLHVSFAAPGSTHETTAIQPGAF